MATVTNEVITSIPTAWGLVLRIGQECFTIRPFAVFMVARLALQWLASQQPHLYQQLVAELNDKPPSA